MKYLLTFFALTILASSSAFACSATDTTQCLTKQSCDALGADFEFKETGSTKCLKKVSSTSTLCTDIAGTAMPKTQTQTPTPTATGTGTGMQQ